MCAQNWLIIKSLRSSQACNKNDHCSYPHCQQDEVSITEEEASKIVDDLLQCRRTDEIEMLATIAEEASIIVEKILATMLMNQNIFDIM